VSDDREKQAADLIAAVRVMVEHLGWRLNAITLGQPDGRFWMRETVNFVASQRETYIATLPLLSGTGSFARAKGPGAYATDPASEPNA
jgi:hypothetical protein